MNRRLAAPHLSSPLVSLLALASLGALALACAPRPPQPQTGPAPGRTSVPTPDLEALLRSMTLDEKIGQMTQADRNALASPRDITDFFLGSILNGGDSLPAPNEPKTWADTIDAYQSAALATRLGIPILYGTDAVHGHALVRGAVVFPHNIGLGASRNAALVEQAAKVTAAEVAGSGAHWSFAPCIAVPRDERWGRTYEGFAETPELVAPLGAAAVRGLEQPAAAAGPDGVAPAGAVLACAKHFLADGGTRNGKDQGDAVISEDELRAIHLPAYAAAIKAGVGSIMVSYSSWNGQPMHGNRRLITDVLKGEMGFQGFVVTDWEAINKMPDLTYEQQVEKSINAGIDLVMVPTNYRDFITTMKELVAAGKITTDRIDDAVRRILRQKARFGLWQRPFADRALTAQIGSAAHREVARQAVRESLVLLKNERRVLPLTKGARINVAGSKADDLGAQCGGWTASWQGKRGPITTGTTLLQAIRAAAASPALVTFSKDEVNDAARAADVNVVVIGEEPYAEGRGDRSIPELTRADETLVADLEALGKPVVVILLTGRPVIVSGAFDRADGVLVAWLPGSEGAGVADVLFGAYKPTGKLPHSWPRELTQIPINAGDAKYQPLFPYGFGLTY